MFARSYNIFESAIPSTILHPIPTRRKMISGAGYHPYEPFYAKKPNPTFIDLSAPHGQPIEYNAFKAQFMTTINRMVIDTLATAPDAQKEAWEKEKAAHREQHGLGPEATVCMWRIAEEDYAWRVSGGVELDWEFTWECETVGCGLRHRVQVVHELDLESESLITDFE